LFNTRGWLCGCHINDAALAVCQLLGSCAWVAVTHMVLVLQSGQGWRRGESPLATPAVSVAVSLTKPQQHYVQSCLSSHLPVGCNLGGFLSTHIQLDSLQDDLHRTTGGTPKCTSVAAPATTPNPANNTRGSVYCWQQHQQTCSSSCHRLCEQAVGDPQQSDLSCWHIS
jgi:hypothetical protein